MGGENFTNREGNKLCRKAWKQERMFLLLRNIMFSRMNEQESAQNQKQARAQEAERVEEPRITC